MRAVFGIRRTRAFFVAALFGALLVLGMWAISSPVGSSPDDVRHLPSIYCAHGDKPGVCERSKPGFAIVAWRLLNTPNCFAYSGWNSAACQTDRDVLLSTNERVEADISYIDQTPGLFYWTMGLFAGDDLERSVMTMRFVNVLIALLLIGAAGSLTLGAARSGSILAWLIVPIPFGMFLIPSTNPSSWAIIGIGTYWALLTAHWTTTSRRLRVLSGVFTALSAVIAIGGRTDSAAYLVVVTIAVFLATWLHRLRGVPRSWPILITPAIAAATAIIVFANASQAAVAVDGMGGERPPSAEGARLLFANAGQLPHLWLGAFGSWPLGWLDTPLPFLVPVTVAVLLFAVFFSGLRDLYTGKALGLLVLVGGVTVLPLWILQVSGRVVGEELQPRYFLPLFFALVGLALLRKNPTQQLSFSAAQRVVIIIGLTTAATLSIAFQIRRYTTGTDGPLTQLDSAREWWSTTWLTPMSAVLVATVAFLTLATVSLFALYFAPAADQTSDDKDRAERSEKHPASESAA